MKQNRFCNAFVEYCCRMKIVDIFQRLYEALIWSLEKQIKYNHVGASYESKVKKKNESEGMKKKIWKNNVYKKWTLKWETDAGRKKKRFK